MTSEHFTQTPATNPLRELAEQYHAECEAYDRTVCSGPILENAIMPLTSRERGLVHWNSVQVFVRLRRRAQAMGYSEGQLWREIGRCA